MSHTVTLEVDLSNREALKKACEKLGLQYQEGPHRVNLFSGGVNADFSVRLPGWAYPIAICADQVKFDNYGGRWGDMAKLEQLQDHYCEATSIQFAESQGWGWESRIEDGEIVVDLYDYS